MLFAVEGCIGSGKSELLALLERTCGNMTCIAEPVAEWQNVRGENLLDAFYKNRHRMTFTMLSYVMTTFVRAYMNSAKDRVVLLERSVSSTRCFANMALDDGCLTTLEWAIYEETLAFYEKLVPSPIFIYLRTSPEKCLERIQKRSRSEESGITIDYLRRLSSQHESWMETIPSERVIYIDGDVEMDVPGRDAKIIDAICKHIVAFSGDSRTAI